VSKKPLVIAIDGPSGAGKGTGRPAPSRARLGYRHIDTGAMYRALAWKALHDGVDLSDEAATAALGERAVFDVEGGRIAIDGHDVAAAIRTPEMDKASAMLARHAAVRRVLVARQRACGEGGGVVMEGRDIGTVVFPDADLKIYLDASRKSGPAAAPRIRRTRARSPGSSPMSRRRSPNATRATRREAVSPLPSRPTRRDRHAWDVRSSAWSRASSPSSNARPEFLTFSFSAACRSSACVSPSSSRAADRKLNRPAVPGNPVSK
jgi:cytidylate kinase